MNSSLEIPTLRKVGLVLGEGQYIAHNGMVLKLRVQSFGPGSAMYIATINGNAHVVMPVVPTEEVTEGCTVEDLSWKLIVLLLDRVSALERAKSHSQEVDSTKTGNEGSILEKSAKDYDEKLKQEMSVEMDAMMRKLRIEVENQHSDWNMRAIGAEARCVALEDEVKMLKLEMENMRLMEGEDRASLEERLTQTQQSLQKAANFGKKLLEDNNELRAQLQQLQQQLEHAEQSSSGNLGGIEVDQRRRLETLSREYEECQVRASGLESTCKELIARLESKEGEVSLLESRVLEFGRRNEEIESQNRSLVQKLKQSTSLADQAVSLNDELEMLRGKFSESSAKEVAQNRLVSSLEERLAVYQSQYEDSHAKTAQENETLLKQVEKMGAELAQKNARISRLEQLQATTDELQTQSSELMDTIASLKEENQLLQRQVDLKDQVIAQQKARALSLVSQSSNASDSVVASPSRKANLGALLQTTPSHSRSPSNGGTTSAAPTSQTPPPAQTEIGAEAQMLLKQQQDQLNSMQAQLEAREKDMATQQRQLMETLTKINLNLVATRPKPPGTCVVLLGNLPEEVIYDPDIIASMEELVGGCEIKSFRWVSKDGEFLGFGFLEFINTKDADKAVSRNGRLYLNRQISIAFATREEFEAGKPSKR